MQRIKIKTPLSTEDSMSFKVELEKDLPPEKILAKLLIAFIKSFAKEELQARLERGEKIEEERKEGEK